MGKQKFIKWATRPSSIAREVPIVLYMIRHGLKRFISVPVDAEKSDYYVDAASYQLLLRNVMKEILRDPSRYLQRYMRDRKMLVEKAKRVSEYADKDGKKLWKWYEKYYRFVSQYSIHFISTFAIEDLVISSLRNIVPEDDLHIITSPGRLLEHHKLQKRLLETDAYTVQEEYGWMNVYNYKEEAYTVSHFKRLQREAHKSEIEHVLSEIKGNQQRFKEIMQSINNEDLKMRCQLAHDCAFIKTDRADQWKKAMFYVRPLFKRISEKQNLTIADVTELKQEEIKDILLHNRYPLFEEIRNRSEKKCFVDMYGSTLKIVCDEKQKRHIRMLVASGVQSARELIGIGSSRGRVRGRVVIASDKFEISKVRKGDILVTTYTTPDFLSAMKKSAAIVTDEGGLTSHAAIIARELKKPCIIGTKIATQVLKDGDLVEVDADKGVVRVLKKI